MPIFDYRCADGHVSESIQPHTRTAIACPACGQWAERLVTYRWSFSNPVAAGAGHEPKALDWTPRMPPIIKGAGCLYVQIAATTTGPSYYASLDYIEIPTATII